MKHTNKKKFTISCTVCLYSQFYNIFNFSTKGEEDRKWLVVWDVRSWWGKRGAVLLCDADTVTSLFLHGSHSGTEKTCPFMIPTVSLSLLCTVDLFSSLFAICLWMKYSRSGTSTRKGRVLCSLELECGGVETRSRLIWVIDDSHCHSWINFKNVGICQRQTLSFVTFFVQTCPMTFHLTSRNTLQFLVSACQKETLFKENQHLQIFLPGVLGFTCL